MPSSGMSFITRATLNRKVKEMLVVVSDWFSIGTVDYTSLRIPIGIKPVEAHWTPQRPDPRSQWLK